MKSLITVKNVSKEFQIGFKKHQSALSRALSFLSGREPKKTLFVLNNISFKVNTGEIIGIIGKNGSGKSTLLRCISNIYRYNGKIITNGKVIPIINLGVGFHYRLTMRENIFLCCSLFGLSRKQSKNVYSSIIEFSELQNFTETKLYQFSNGMKNRLAFSIAIHCNPDILLLDEVFEVGDEGFREKSAKKIHGLAKKGSCVILISHDLDMIEKHCDRALWIEEGSILKKGKTKEIVAEYKIRQ
jgi:ABC-2 type transport system ATP-binding protein